MNQNKIYRYLNTVTAIFVTVLIVSNIASSAKIVDLGFKVLGVPMAFDAGTILFPISYIFGDILTEVYGYRNSRRVIWTGFFCLSLAAITFWIVSILPGEATWQGYAGDAAYQVYAQNEAVAAYTHVMELGKEVSINPEQLHHLYARRGRAMPRTPRSSSTVRTMTRWGRVFSAVVTRPRSWPRDMWRRRFFWRAVFTCSLSSARWRAFAAETWTT